MIILNGMVLRCADRIIIYMSVEPIRHKDITDYLAIYNTKNRKKNGCEEKSTIIFNGFRYRTYPLECIIEGIQVKR